MNDTTVYGFGRKPDYYKWRTPLEYHLFAADRQPELIRQRPARSAAPKAGEKKKANARAKSKAKAKKQTRPAGGRVLHPRYNWSCQLPFLVRAMVLAQRTLFIAGPPDLVDEEEAFRLVGDPEMTAKLAAQEAALAGANGALLWAVSAANGKKLAEYRLDKLPVFDGMAAADGCLYMATTEGTVLCFTGGEE